MIDDVDRAIMTVLQDGFPLVPRPYEDKTAELGLSEQELIDRIARMRESGIVTLSSSDRSTCTSPGSWVSGSFDAATTRCANWSAC